MEMLPVANILHVPAIGAPVLQTPSFDSPHPKRRSLNICSMKSLIRIAIGTGITKGNLPAWWQAAGITGSRNEWIIIQYISDKSRTHQRSSTRAVGSPAFLSQTNV
jgi:hypothetical protein